MIEINIFVIIYDFVFELKLYTYLYNDAHISKILSIQCFNGIFMKKGGHESGLVLIFRILSYIR